MEIVVVVGTRPELIKMAPVMRAMRHKRNVKPRLVHTGQHYDDFLSGVFFRDFSLPNPERNLNVGSGPPGKQTALIVERLESYLKETQPDLVLSEGDTNSVLASALASIKCDIPFGHVEAGLRCFDSKMPEETNRVVADHCAAHCFAPTPRAVTNLALEGIPLSRVFLTGNTIVDACTQHLEIAMRESKILPKLGLNHSGDEYILLTVHREENTGSLQRLRELVTILRLLAKYHVVFPIHPRTLNALKREGLWSRIASMAHVTLVDPLSYLDFLLLEARAFAILTDSGGVQEEALSLGVPCIILRSNTERPEGVRIGLNIVAQMDHRSVIQKLRSLRNTVERGRSPLHPNPIGDGRAGERIVEICTRLNGVGSHNGVGSDNHEMHSPNGCYDYRLVSAHHLPESARVICYFDPGGQATSSVPRHNNIGDWKALILN